METLITKTLTCFSNMFVKLPEIVTSIGGWVTMIILFIANFCTGYETMICMVAFAIVSDAFWGIWVAIRRGKFVLSELGRDTLIKVAAYGNAIFVLIGIEHIIGADYHITTAVATTVICAVELWSISGNVLIIKPNFPFFRLFRPALRGEISRKLGISTDEVDDILDSKKPL